MEIEVDEDGDTGSPPPPVSVPVPATPSRREDRTGDRRPSNSVNDAGPALVRGKEKKVVEKVSAETTRLCLVRQIQCRS